jgi:hypothetical protein
MPGAVGEQLLQTLLALDAADRRRVRHSFDLTLVVGGHGPAGDAGRPITTTIPSSVENREAFSAASTRADSRASIVPSEFTL